MKHIVFSFILTVLLFCSCGSNGRSSESRQARLDGRVVTDEGEANTTKSEITAEMAYEGVSNYCHSAYDWSVAKENPSIMYVQMGEENDSAYQVVFRSYTGHSSISMSIKPVTQREWKNMFQILMSKTIQERLIYSII